MSVTDRMKILNKEKEILAIKQAFAKEKGKWDLKKWDRISGLALIIGVSFFATACVIALILSREVVIK